jgi:hypothetical protein
MRKLKLYVALVISAMMVFNSSFAVMAVQGDSVSANEVPESAAETVVSEVVDVSANEILSESNDEVLKESMIGMTEDLVEAEKAGKSFLEATAINVNTAVSDSIGYIGEDNYYKFTLTTPGVVRIVFSHPLYECVEGSSDWWICLYDSNREAIYGFDAKDGYTVSTYSPQIGLSAGTYYLCIEDFYASDEVMMMTYTFKIEYQVSSAWEKEFNDGWLSATRIELNTNVYGSLMQSYDNDYYVFYNDAYRCVKINFSHPQFEGDITGWDIYLYDANHNLIQLFDASNGYKTMQSGEIVCLPAGTYYVLVDLHLSNDYHRDSTYTLKVSAQPPVGTVVTYNGLKYKVARNGTKCYMQCIGPVSKSITKATIKSEIRTNGFKYPVCQIKSNAFKNCKRLKKLVIGDNIKTIGEKAFYGCKKLKSITIQSKKLAKVKSKAFKGINKYAKIKVPKSKLSKYKKLLKKAGVKSTAKFK